METSHFSTGLIGGATSRTKSGTQAAASTQVYFRPPDMTQVTSLLGDLCPSDGLDWRSTAGRSLLNTSRLSTARLDTSHFSTGLIGGAMLSTKSGRQVAACSSTSHFSTSHSQVAASSAQCHPSTRLSLLFRQTRPQRKCRFDRQGEHDSLPDRSPLVIQSELIGGAQLAASATHVTF